jgi:type I restriction-modification system DNA methylase subunit
MFQNSVLKSFSQDEGKVALRWAEYQKYLAKIDFVKQVKEEKYQDGFLQDVFEKCLGYTLDSTNPDDFNLEREKKNETDSKKADGVIYVDNKVVGIIELKSQDTKNLDKKPSKSEMSPIDQAFGYLVSHSDAKYVIVSNFDELRFYFDKKIAYDKFNLFDLNYEEFKKLHLLVSFESISQGIPLQLKDKTNNFEQEISKSLYKDFSLFRTHLFENVIKNNSAIDKSILLRLTQKLCDRIIFILFAEDRGLLTANTIKEIRTRHSQDGFGDRSIYDYYKLYFDAINEGNNKLQIPKYNGGLFATDTVIDSLIIDDNILDKEVQKLSDYDFASEVSVNILGHIFEQSLTDLEELQSNIENKDFDKTKTKRKKDGVFYTPEYITKYIVENTLGKMCTQKREELNILEVLVPKNSKKLTIKEQQIKTNIGIYKEWLFNLKILDPACGSGAFLNQALEYLISEHNQLQKDLTVLGDITSYYSIEESVLENNLYGVDINEDAVEIAKLSLWLRTAKKGRPLTKLANKIKCGNSLISDKSVVDNAFVWEEEFKEVFENGGFDIVIGNPPYFNIQTLGAKSPIAQSIQNSYPEIWQDKSDIIFYFIAKAIQLTKNKVSFIVSNAFLFSDKAKKLRNYILDNINVSKITNFEKYMVFEDASITTAIIEFDKQSTNQKTLAYSFKDKNYDKEFVSNSINFENDFFEVNLKKDIVFALVDNKISSINDKIDNNNPKLNTIFKIGKGMETAANKQFIFKEYPTHFPKEFIKKRMSGEIIKKYEINGLKEYILYFENIDNFEDLPQSIQNHLYENKDFLENRATVKNEGRIWWRYSRPMHKDFYNLNKIWCSYRAKENIFCFDNTNKYIGLTNTTVIFDTNENLDLKYLLSLLNSKTLNFRYKSIGKQTGSGVYEYFENGVGKLPIPEIDKEQQQPFINLVDNILTLKEKIAKYKKHFDSLNAVEKIDIKEEIEKLENCINQSINEIDNMVYELYGLSEEEIKIVEEIKTIKK